MKKLFVIATLLGCGVCYADAQQDYQDALREAMSSGNSKEYRRLIEQGAPKEAAKPAEMAKRQSSGQEPTPSVREFNDHNSRSYSYPTASQQQDDYESGRRQRHLDDVGYQADLEEQKLRRDDYNDRRQDISDHQHERNMRAQRELNAARDRAAREAVDGPQISDDVQAQRDRDNLADAYRSGNRKAIRAAQARAGVPVDPLPTRRSNTVICNSMSYGSKNQYGQVVCQ